MPKYNPTDEDMESMYPSESGAAKPESTTGESEKPKAEDETMAPTAVVDLKILQPPDGSPVKEGDEIVVRVVKVYGDEAEIEYAPAKKGGGESYAGSEAGMSSDEELESLSKET